MHEKLKKLVKKGFVGRIELDEERPFFDEDFKEHRDNSLGVFEFLNSVCFSNEPDFIKYVVPEIFCLCGENRNSSNPWVSEAHTEYSTSVLNKLKMECFESELSFDNFLINNETILVKECLKVIIRPNLEEGWKLYPGTYSCLEWIFKSIKFPHMGRYVPEFLPFILRFTDDWEPIHRVRGIHMIQHMINECSWNTELDPFGRKDLISKTLHHLLHTRDIEVIEILYSTLIVFYEKSWSFGTIGKELLPKLLDSMVMTSDISLKRVYSQYFSEVIAKSDISIVPWFSKIVKVIDHFCVYPDPCEEKFRINAQKGLAAMLHIVSHNGLEFPFRKYTRELLESLITLAYEISKREEDILLNLIETNLIALRDVSSEEVLTLCDGLESVKATPKFNSLVVSFLKPRVIAK